MQERRAPFCVVMETCCKLQVSSCKNVRTVRFKLLYRLLFHFRLIIVRIVKFYKGVNIVLIFGLSFILFLIAVYVSFV